MKQAQEHPKECCAPGASKYRFPLERSSCRFSKHVKLFLRDSHPRFVLTEPFRVELLGNAGGGLYFARPTTVRHPIEQIWNCRMRIEIGVIERLVDPHATLLKAGANKEQRLIKITRHSFAMF